VRNRAEHAGEIIPRVRAALMARTALEWEEIFGDRVPCSAARTIEDMFDHPQVRAEHLVAEFDHPLVGRYRGFAKPVTSAAHPVRSLSLPRRSASIPKKSSRTSAIRATTFCQLRRRGVVGPVDDSHPRDIDA
jgi:crotonobetainyl-CoA:carnitine CoA-transferase CaiB-like acyl-CoA transferase